MNKIIKDGYVAVRWVRWKDAPALLGIGKTLLRRLVDEGEVRSAVMRQPGGGRAIRFVDAASFDAYLDRLAGQSAVTVKSGKEVAS